MTVLIVGGDRIETYRSLLEARGYAPVHHWTGRKGSDCHREIPEDTRLIVVLPHFVNHGLATKIRRSADLRALPIVFSRSVARLDQLVSKLN